MKTILALWHGGNKGKTETLREFAHHLLASYPHYKPLYPLPASVPPKGDFRLVVEIHGKIIGIESQGDPGTQLENRLNYLDTHYTCDLILCSSRTRGETVHAIENVANNGGFQTIWTSTYQIGNATLHHRVNQLKATHILDLVQQLGLI